jgi:predicted  nucleic acid-binding Zn-ribbon protein
MSNTPRTDVAQHNMGSVAEPHYVVDVDFAQQFERELAEAQAEITRLKGEAESWEKVFDRTCEHLADAKTALAEAVAKERERCAKVSEEYPGALHTRQEELMAYDIAAEIRKGE